MQERTVNFREAFLFWLKLGFISFGGPAGQIGIMHAELVDRRRWISERRFLHALNYCMLLPGPEATQLAIYIGWLLHGTLGGIVAGVLFVLPSVFVLLGLSAVYVAYGHVPAVEGVFYGMKAAIIAVVVFAVIRIGRRSIRNVASLALAVASFVAMLLGVPFPLIILTAGLVGYLGARFRPDWFTIAKHAEKHTETPGEKPVIADDHAQLPHTLPSKTRLVRHVLVGSLLWAGPVALLVAWQGWEGEHTRMAWFFSLSALVTFGGAYAVLPFIAHYAVEVFGWLRRGQMIDGLALGETTPGPLIMVVAFVGFVGGWQKNLGWEGAVLGGLVATYFTFLPSFLFILLGAPFIEGTRESTKLNAALSGITAAVVGVVLHLAVFFGERVFILEDGVLDMRAMALAAAAMLALGCTRLGLIPVMLGCGLVGLLLRLLF